MLKNIFSSPRFFRIASGILRLLFPVLKIKGWVIVSRYNEVKEILERDKDFTIAEINAAKMKALDLNFFLGMDDSEIHTREKKVMEKVARPGDLPFIQKILADKSQEIIETVSPAGKIEIVNTLSRVVPLTLIEKYFGVPVENEKQMQSWMRGLFNQLFLNLTNDGQIASRAKKAADELKIYLTSFIENERRKFAEGREMPDTLVTRLLLMSGENNFIDNDFIRRNISGLMIGAVDTTSKCVVLVIQELLKRPEILSDAMDLAKKGNTRGLNKYCNESLRFNPHNPIVLRYSPKEFRIGKNGKYRIPADRKIAVGIFSAMHDSDIFIHPGTFNAYRENDYLHFSYGMHACFGRYINAVQIPEIVASVLRLQNLRASSKNNGNVIYDGPFPQEYWVNFK